MGKAKKQSVQDETIDLSMAEKILDHYKDVDGCLIPVLQKDPERIWLFTRACH